MLYTEHTADYPKLKTDSFFSDRSNTYKYDGFMQDAFDFVAEKQLTNTELWKRFVNQFRTDADSGDRGWRGEFWGKMMRGACFVYSYSKDAGLYEILKQTVIDMMESADEYGRISTYKKDGSDGTFAEFDGWDMWSRKYVLLGMEYFCEICTDDAMKEKITDSMCAQLDYITEHIGSAEGQIEITSATRNWHGLNSSSILEPVVRLYSITKRQKYLDFAKYIVECGGTDITNIFDLAYNNELYPYQYPVTKAYEMTSCFEGLLEYYRVTGNEKYKTAVINYAEKILESDFTVIGCSGCTHELFDHSTVRQANPTSDDTSPASCSAITSIMQETCVTVTLMKFFWQLASLTGESKYADAFETSLYNAYLGSFNTEGNIASTTDEVYPECAREAMPFDSYSPLCAGVRGSGVGGLRKTADNHYYGCCAAIGAVGMGLVPKMHLMHTKLGFVINLYINGTAYTKAPDGSKVCFVTETAYPADGNVKITIKTNTSSEFELKLRNPYWSKNTAVTVCGRELSATKEYIVISKIWQDGDTVELCFDMRTEAIRPIPYGRQIIFTDVRWGYDYITPVFDKEPDDAKHHVALRRGPIMLAQENRLGYNVDDAVSIKINHDGYVDAKPAADKLAPYPNITEIEVPLCDGSVMHLTDYASAGKLWTKESKTAVWILTK